ncbi:MAG: nitroreductase family protein [Eubacterium sp.]|nr:nitroreductase family protein [Eubacterium sp.]
MTNSEYIQAIEMRTSRRSYKSVLLDEQTMANIKDLVDYVNSKANLNFFFIEDASPAFSIFSGRFSAVAVCGKDTASVREDCGFYGETIVLQCAYHGLGTCWVSGTFNENKILEMIDLPEKSLLYGVIVIGFANSKRSLIENVMYKATHKNSKPYQKMFEVCDEKLPQHFEYAMQLVEKAPSAVNRRPVNFRYENGVVSASVDEPYSDKSIDFGIAKLHFQLGASAKGIKGEWIDGTFVEDKNRVLKFPKVNSNHEEKGDSENE